MPTNTADNTPKKKSRRSHSRVQLLLDAAAKLFATKGYKETTLRDIGAEIGMVAGSVYYHFDSKQELLLAVYKVAVEGIMARQRDALAEADDPWDRLEIAVTTHVETILDQDDYARVMVGVLPGKAPEIEKPLRKMRDDYEKIFVELIEELPLLDDVDRGLLRLMLLGSINSAQSWYHKGGIAPSTIGQEFVRYLKEPIGKV